jgi:hypothetical protein
MAFSRAFRWDTKRARDGLWHTDTVSVSSSLLA